MLEYIRIRIAELWETGKEQKTQNENNNDMYPTGFEQTNSRTIRN